MSANCSDLLRLGAACCLTLVLTGCVTTPEQAASRSDISWFARSLDQDPFSEIDPEEFRDTAREALTRLRANARASR